MRINVNHNNIADISKLKSIIVKYNWLRNPNFTAYISPIRTVMNKNISCFSLFDLHQIHTFGKLQDGIIGINDYGITRKFKKLLLKKHFFPFKISFCSANRGTYIFDPSGDIYSCWRVIGKTEESIGKYIPELQINEFSYRNWRNRTINNIPKCQNCKYALFCGGGCGGLAYEKSKRHFSPFCDDYDKLFSTLVLQIYLEFLQSKTKEKVLTRSKKFNRKGGVKCQRRYIP